MTFYKDEYIDPFCINWWIDKDGNVHEIQNMSTPHIKNCIRMLRKDKFKRIMFEGSLLESSFLKELNKRDENV